MRRRDDPPKRAAVAVATRRGVGGLALVALVWGSGLPGAAATTITEPSTRPIPAPVDVEGHLVPLTIRGGGFLPGAPVYVEQCDGVDAAAPQWSPTEHCDLGGSPAAAITDAHGVATFAVSDATHAFVPFVGESPQSIFNCVTRREEAPNNGLPTFTNCQLRVSTNNTVTTTDQAFARLTLPAGAKPSLSSPSAVSLPFTAAPLPSAATAPPTTTAPGSGAAISRVTSVPSQADATVSAAASAPMSASPTSTTMTSRPSSSVGARAAARVRANPKPGLLAISDAGVAIGYALLVVGLAFALIPAARLRRRRLDRVGSQQ